MEIANSILLIFINLFIMKFLLTRNFKRLGYALILTFLFIIFNLFFGDLPNKLIPVTWFYSFSLLILSYMSSLIDVTRNTKISVSEEDKARFQKIKFYSVNVIMPILATIFQIMLMFDTEMQRGF